MQFALFSHVPWPEGTDPSRIPSLHHPIRLAEDTATLDRISRGWLDVGFGRGSAGYEYRGYNIDRDDSSAALDGTLCDRGDASFRLMQALDPVWRHGHGMCCSTR